MIVDFADKATEKVFQEQKPPELPPEILKRALAKLQQLHVSATLNDLRVPPSNRLGLLKGSRAGQYSIRINDQWRIPMTSGTSVSPGRRTTMRLKSKSRIIIEGLDHDCRASADRYAG